MSRTWVGIFVACWLSIAVGAAVGPRRVGVGDARHYLLMARAGAAAAPAPFGYRVFAPAIVASLPLAPESGFFLLTYLASGACLLVTRRLLRALGIGANAALATVALLGVSYPIAFYLGNWGLIDPLANLFALCALTAVVERRWVVAGIALALGCLAKETVLLLLPLCLGQAATAPGSAHRRAARTLVLAAAPLAVFLALHAAVTPVNSPGSTLHVASVAGLLGRPHTVLSYNTTGFGLAARVGREVVRAFGFFWVVGALGVVLLPVRLRLACGCLLLMAVGLCLVAADWSRMLAWAYPAVFVPVACFVEAAWGKGRRATAGLVALGALAVVQAYLALLAYNDLGAGARGLLVGATVAVFVAGSAIAIAIRPERTHDATPAPGINVGSARPIA